MDTSKIRQYAEILREADLTALEVHADGTIRLERTSPIPCGAPVFDSRQIPPSQEAIRAEQPADASASVITSPMVGVFYLAPAENAEPFVQVGTAVHQGDVLCIIEAMKLMNEITTESDGVIEAVFVENGAVVEFGQPLFALRKGLS